jgi:hypothetical protein
MAISREFLTLLGADGLGFDLLRQTQGRVSPEPRIGLPDNSGEIRVPAGPESKGVGTPVDCRSSPGPTKLGSQTESAPSHCAAPPGLLIALGPSSGFLEYGRSRLSLPNCSICGSTRPLASILSMGGTPRIDSEPFRRWNHAQNRVERIRSSGDDRVTGLNGKSRPPSAAHPSVHSDVNRSA